MKETITIGTRASALAMTQTRWVAASLEKAHPNLTVELKQITSKGDTITQVPLARIGGTGVFTRELETALVGKDVDLAVHSLKDLPVELPPGLALACVPVRENPHDVLVAKDGIGTVDDLPAGAKVGTSSPRRQAQILAARPDVRCLDIRGNVDTRLRKLATDLYDAIVLARAGLNRLQPEMDCFSHADIPFEIMLPAPGQGALGIETRADDERVRGFLAVLHDRDTAVAASTERRLLSLLGGGCSIPFGAFARCEGTEILLDAVVCATDGTMVIRASAAGPQDQWKEVTDEVHQELAERGADRILQDFEEQK